MTKNVRDEIHSTPANENSLPGDIQETAANVGNKLKEAAQEVDNRTGASNALDQAGSKAKEVQHQVQEDGIQETAANFGNKLKEVAQEVDKRTGASNALDQAGSKAKEVQHHVQDGLNEHVAKPATEAGSNISETARNATGAVNEHVVEPAVHNVQGAWNATQEQLQQTGSGISETARNATGAVNEHVAEPAVHNVQGAWNAAQQQLQQFDEHFQVTSTATSALESGKDFLSKTLGGHSDQQTPEESSSQEKKDSDLRHSR
jgi:hypothetical protein